MSNDTRIMLWYEPQPYAGNFPQSEVDDFNLDPELVWIAPLKAGGDKWTFIGWLDHYPYKVIEDTKADKVYICSYNTNGSGEVKTTDANSERES